MAAAPTTAHYTARTSCPPCPKWFSLPSVVKREAVIPNLLAGEAQQTVMTPPAKTRQQGKGEWGEGPLRWRNTAVLLIPGIPVVFMEDPGPQLLAHGIPLLLGHCHCIQESRNFGHLLALQSQNVP